MIAKGDPGARDVVVRFFFKYIFRVELEIRVWVVGDDDDGQESYIQKVERNICLVLFECLYNE
jgi:hypothetical protein